MRTRTPVRRTASGAYGVPSLVSFAGGWHSAAFLSWRDESDDDTHFWQLGQKKVERPCCTMRFTVPLQLGQGSPSRSYTEKLCWKSPSDPSARRWSRKLDPPALIASLSTARIASTNASVRAFGLPLRSAIVEARRFGESRARKSASQT